MKKKVYILEDDVDLREILVHVLANQYEIREAESLDISSIVEFQPDLILMDHGVGQTTSGQNLQELRSKIQGFATPVILLSGHPKIASLAISESVAGYIQKPAGIFEIRKYVEDFFTKPGEPGTDNQDQSPV